MSPEETNTKKTRDSSSEKVLAFSGARNGPGTVQPILPDEGISKANDFALIKKALSPERFESHRRTAGESDEVIFQRYQWNAEVCEHFYAPLRILEVVLRNSFNESISSKANDVNWLTAIPQWLQPNGREDVVKAHDFLKERNKPITQARVVQEMSFGFWTSLLNSKYETLFHAIGAKVFPTMPKPIRTRANASVRFESIRDLRNRIFHFRRIWNRPNLENDFHQILEAIEWVNPDARRLLLPAEALADFRDVYSRRT